MWVHFLNVRTERIGPMTASLAWSSLCLFLGPGIGLFEFLDNLQDAVTADHRIIDVKFQDGSVFEHDRTSDEILNASAVPGQQHQAALLLLLVAKDADKNDCGVQIARDIDVIDRHEPDLADGELAADHLANLALEQFANALEPE